MARSRRRLKTKAIDVKKVEKQLKSLIDGKRFREAVIYSYQIFIELIKGHLNKAPTKSQTYREFIMGIIKETKLDPTLVYPFTTLYEEARYSRHSITPTAYSEANRMFGKLFQLIVGELVRVEVVPRS
ncbi:MAG: hypothetical protein HWN67_00575 [Candidatus Helarchaeota archaeon]|nr:hypothetical protein [Candidatus Helarchaeota archaeon]